MKLLQAWIEETLCFLVSMYPSGYEELPIAGKSPKRVANSQAWVSSSAVYCLISQLWDDAYISLLLLLLLCGGAGRQGRLDQIVMLLCLTLPGALYLYNDIVLAFVRLLTAGEDFLARCFIPMLLKEKSIVK